MVDLDPENVSSRIKLAELYARESMNTEAQQEFRRAAEYLKRNSRTDDYLRVAERLASLDPNDIPLSRELAAPYLQKGDQKRALARLRRHAPFLARTPILSISAKTGQRVERVLEAAIEIAAERRRRIPTPVLNAWLREVTTRRPPAT